MIPNYWFTADTHFGHKNVIKHANRPFTSIEEMDEALIANWNSLVKPGDQIYHLGDFAFLPVAQIHQILKRLNGELHLILGNHDEPKVFAGFANSIKDTKTIKVGDQKIFLSHYAHRVWNCSHYGAWNLHGHSHGTLPRLPGYKQLDVGVDCFYFKPVHFEEIKVIMDQVEFAPVEHHGRGK